MAKLRFLASTEKNTKRANALKVQIPVYSYISDLVQFTMDTRAQVGRGEPPKNICAKI